MSSERDLIATIARRVAKATAKGAPALPQGSCLLQGIGDDCAVLRPDPAALSLLTTDTLVEGVHFDLSWHPPRLLGRKAVAVNISDIAAMGGRPRFLLLSLGLSGREPEEWLNQLLDGFIEAMEEYGATLIGGDTVRNPAGVMLSVTVLGEVVAPEVCLRSGGRVGDSIWVGGPLGLAAAGLELCRRGLKDDPAWQPLVQAHLDPRAQVELGRALVSQNLAHAMMDLSDGLATDLAHLCAASGLGAEVAAELLPTGKLLDDAADLCRVDPLTWATSGGEDYRLLFTCAPEDDQAIMALGQTTTQAEPCRIGHLVPEPGVFLAAKGGRREIGFGGYDHFR
ncbi:MAG: thiamine-phosphate kinase [Desulfurivibrio sp.]